MPHGLVQTVTPAWRAVPQVYAKLAAIKAWNEWNKGHWVLHAPGQELLGVGDKFSYTAPFVLGNVQAEVQDAAEAKVWAQPQH